MSKWLKNIINCIVLIGILVIAWLYCERVLRPVYSDMSLATIEAFHSLPANSQDVIIYGSSHSWRGVNAKQLYDDYQINAYNYSCMWQRLNTTDLFVHDSLLTQNPKVAVIDMGNLHDILSDSNMVGEIYYTRELKNTEAKKKYLRGCFGNNLGRYVTYYLPLSMYHSGWEDISSESFEMTNLSPEKFTESRGYLGFSNCEKIEISDGSDYWEDVIPDRSMELINDMVDTLQGAGVEVLLITIPYYSNEFIYRDALKEYAKEKGCNYLDFFELSKEISLDGNTDFSEWDHLNDSGATKVTEYLGKYLRDNYDL